MTKKICLRGCKQLMLIIISFGLISCGGGSNAKGTNVKPLAKEKHVIVINNKNITLSSFDANGDSLTYSIVTQPLHGIVVLNGNIASYKVSENYVGTDSFSFKVNDGVLDSLPAKITITINDLSTSQKALKKIQNYVKDSTTAVIPSVQDYIDAGIEGITVENLDNVNTLIKSKTVDDIKDLTALVDLLSEFINSSKNKPPKADENLVLIMKNQSSKVITLTGTAKEGEILSYSITTQPIHGTLTINNNVVNYIPKNDYLGTDSFTFIVNDGVVDSEPATINIIITDKEWGHGKLEASNDNHMLQHEDGTGFFWMADTAWFTAAKLDREEIDTYLSNREEKGFNVVMVNIMSNVWNENAYGDIPFPVIWNDYNSSKKYNDVYQIDNFILTEGNNPENDIAYDYWDHVAYMIDKAAEKGIYIAMVLTWGADSEQFIEDKKSIYQAYIKQLTTLFKNKPNLIWISGGDVFNSTLMKKDKWDWIGEAVKKEDSNHLLGFHGQPSSYAHHNKAWLDFNMIESGHYVDTVKQNQMITNDYKRTPSKPVVDGESRYEEIKIEEPSDAHRITAAEVREIEYFQLFSGAFGVTYGHNSIWQMATEDEVSKGEPESGYGRRIFPIHTWDEVLDTEGANAMKILGKLVRSRPILGRVPDQSLIMNHKRTARGTLGDGYAMVYTTSDNPLPIALGKVSGSSVNIWSYNPRTGEAKLLKESIANSDSYTFNPDDGEDWVVVIDDVSRNYGVPGA